MHTHTYTRRRVFYLKKPLGFWLGSVCLLRTSLKGGWSLNRSVNRLILCFILFLIVIVLARRSLEKGEWDEERVRASSRKGLENWRTQILGLDQSRRPRPICTPIYTLGIRRHAGDTSLNLSLSRPSFNPLLFHTRQDQQDSFAHTGVLEFAIGVTSRQPPCYRLSLSRRQLISQRAKFSRHVTAKVRSTVFTLRSSTLPASSHRADVPPCIFAKSPPAERRSPPPSSRC